MPCRSTSYSIRRVSRLHIKERGARIGAPHRMSASVISGQPIAGQKPPVRYCLKADMKSFMLSTGMNVFVQRDDIRLRGCSWRWP